MDELDRCLPEYTIKVLERLHHLFDGIPNVQVLLSIDIAQLKHVVRQIYGDETDVKNYLRIFIQFEVFLGEGVVNDKFNERFKQYTSHFQVESSSTSAIDVDEFKTIILAGIDMRSRISIVDRCLLIHSLSDADDTLDLSYMCLELLLVVLNDYGIDVDHAKNLINITEVFEKTRLRNDKKEVTKGLAILSSKYSTNRVYTRGSEKILYRDSEESSVNVGCLLGKLLYAYRGILGFEDQYTMASFDNDIIAFFDYGKKFWNYLQIIH